MMRVACVSATRLAKWFSATFAIVSAKPTPCDRWELGCIQVLFSCRGSRVCFGPRVCFVFARASFLNVRGLRSFIPGRRAELCGWSSLLGFRSVALLSVIEPLRLLCALIEEKQNSHLCAML